MTLDADLARLPEDRDLVVSVTTGTEHWRAGQIALSVGGDGAAIVDHRRDGEHRRYTGTLGRDELARLGAELAELGFARLERSRSNFARGEETVTIELRRGGDVLHHADLPEGDRYDDPRLDRIIQRYEEVVQQVTDGDLPRGPAAAPR